MPLRPLIRAWIPLRKSCSKGLFCYTCPALTTLHKRSQDSSRLTLSPSQVEWALLVLALIVAFILRFYRLGEFPPGLYRDEAINGLDALKVLQGEHAFFFTANNGREPLYIYLTAGAISLFGQTAFAVRLAAAVIGALTTLPVFLLGKSWFGWRVGVLAAWVVLPALAGWVRFSRRTDL